MHLERAIEWLDAPLKWAVERPTPSRRLGAIFLVLPLFYIIVWPLFMLMIVDWWRNVR
jgi:hypothetical protein